MMRNHASDEYLTDRRRICDLLVKLCRRLAPLHLYIEGGNNPCLTSIVLVDPDNDIFLLDTPPGGLPQAAKAGSCINVHGDIDGVDLLFETRFTSVPMQAGIPESVLYRQRREDFRVHVGLGDGLTILLPVKNESEVTGIVRNLSAGGVGIEIRFSIEHADWHPGVTIENCALELPGQDNLICKLKVCHMDRINRDCFRVGAKFVDLPPTEERRLRQYAMRLEREQQRRTPAMDD